MNRPPPLRILLQLLLPALAYYLAGKLGLLLAIPPGFASAVWPAAGVALTFALLRPGLITLLGIGFGSFAVNLGVISNVAQLNLISLITPAVIACGAILQAAAGAWLFRQLLGQARTFDAPQAIARFMLIVAPASCLIAATIGVSILYERGIITPDNALFTWSTWWVGDAIGALLITPLALEIFSRKASPFRARRWQILVPSCVLLLCVSLLFSFSKQSRHQQIEADIDADCAELFHALEQVFSGATQNLAAHQALFTSQSEFDWAAFERFSQTLSIHNHGLFGVAWNPRVTAEQRAQFERDTQAQGLDGFHIRQLNGRNELESADLRDTYYPVQYIFPLEANTRALGFDLASRPDRRAALDQAISTGRPAATRPLTLVQNNGEHEGLILYLPVYREQQLLGFVSGIFRTIDLFNQVTQQAQALRYGLQLRDITEADQPVLIIAAPQPPLGGFSARHFTLDFGGRTLEASIYPDQTYLLATKDWTSWSILTLGFLITALLQTLLLLLTGTNEQIGREVLRKTRSLKKAVKQAQAADQAKSDFLANMSHELRTPLNAVTLLINRCLKTDLDQSQSSLLTNARLAADTLMSLINHTLDYSKIGAGQLTLEHIDFSLQKILEKMTAIFSIQAETKQVAFELDVPHPLPPLFNGDPLRIEQILFNLCGNALKFTPQGQVTLSVNYVASTPAGPQVEIIVSDTGIGISHNKQAQLFNAFSQADSSTTRQYGGTGLGLAICKSLTDLMGGRIAIESQEGTGTRVSVTLPLKPAATATDYPVQVPLAEQPLADKHLLLVEDIAINRELATFLLEDFGAKVTGAENGRHALAQLALHPDIDLVLMDIQMPEMDGYQATAAIRQMPGHENLPIIAMTANAVNSDIDACLAAGMNDHVGKPIDEAALISTICKHLPQ